MQLKFCYYFISIVIITGCQSPEQSDTVVSNIEDSRKGSLIPNLEYAVQNELSEEQPDQTQINTLQSRTPTPEGYKRTSEPQNSFQDYLRNLPLKPPNAKVKYYNGDTKYSDVYEAVVDLPIGNKDLHQCADAVMRLRAEYLWKNKNYDQIHFNFTNGHKVEYSEWMVGNRMNIKGNKTWWTTQAEPSNTYNDFWEYMELIFMYAGTASLEKELKPIDIGEAEIGDVLIKGGFPGHAVIIVDKATQNSSGESIYLIAQSYMPAQEIHVLKNFSHSDIRPWYRLEEGEIFTPEWAFTSNDMKRFVD